jgi:hypothetical protein
MLMLTTSNIIFAADGNFVNISASGQTGLGMAYDINHTLTVIGQTYGPGMGPVYVKTSNSAQNSGSAFTFLGVDAAVRAENVQGNGYSTAIGAFSHLWNNNSTAFFSSTQDGSYAAKLTYRDVNGKYWAGCFSDKVLITAPVWTTGSTATLGLGDNGPNHCIMATYGKGLTLKTVGTNSYIILQEVTGNVGIGKDPSTSTAKLQVAGDTRVDGKIYCKELRVQTNAWADYVFSSNYKMKSLEEVEKYISANKHLPGIPSEKEILKKGVNVVDLQTRMLKTMEEMTLRMITMKKENDMLAAKVAEFSNRIEK